METVTIQVNASLKYGLELFATILKEDLVEQTSDWNAGVTAIQSGAVASSQLALGILQRSKEQKTNLENGRLHQYLHFQKICKSASF